MFSLNTSIELHEKNSRLETISKDSLKVILIGKCKLDSIVLNRLKVNFSFLTKKQTSLVNLTSSLVLRFLLLKKTS